MTAHASPQTGAVLQELADERRSHVAKGYTPEHDDQHQSPTDWVLLVAPRVWATEALEHRSPERRRAMVEAASILVAAIESIDRPEPEPDDPEAEE